MRHITNKGIEFIKNEEGFVDHTYFDEAAIATIGYGHKLRSGESFVGSITHEKGEEILKADVAWAEEAVEKKVTVPLTNNEFDALVSFTFNVGATAFADSTLLRLLNAGQYEAVPIQMNRWIWAGGRISPVLTGRRKREGNLFMEGDGEKVTS